MKTLQNLGSRYQRNLEVGIGLGVALLIAVLIVTSW